MFPLAGLADFLIGVLISKKLGSLKISSHWRTVLQIIALLALATTVYLKGRLYVNYNRAFVPIPAIMLIVISFSVETPFSKAVFGNKVMSFIGDISFEFYLIHVVAMSMINRFGLTQYISLAISPFMALVINIIICMIGAYVYKLLADKILERVKNKKF